MNDFIQTLNNLYQECPLIIKILAITVTISFLFRHSRRKIKKEDKQIVEWDDTDYQSSILDALPEDTKLDYSHLYGSIEEINRMASRCQNYLYAQKIEAADSIQRKIKESSAQIEQKWRKLQRNKDFYHYIGLHYASFTLADSIKKEQEVLRDAFVDAKKESERLGAEIELLNKAIPNARGQRRYELMQQHQRKCSQHQRVCQMKNIFGRRNSEYLEQVKTQNRITREYREYIVHNFGRKGIAWGQRLQKRKMDQISL